MNEEFAVREALRHWLASANGKIHAEQINDDLPLLTERVVTSLQVTDLLLFIEELRGYPVKIEEIQPSSFQDINHICHTFFKGAKPCV